MSYPTIQPPFTLKFREMPKKELKCYNEWFHNSIPGRIQVLFTAIKATPGYEKWEPDYSAESIGPLGDWFLEQVETRPRTQEEMGAIQSRSKFPIHISNEELTNKKFSLAIDIGMYLSQVFLENHPSLEWSQPLRNKRFIDYGQPVLDGFSTLSFNPVRMMVTHAYGLKSGNRNSASLRKLYDYWATLARGEKPPAESGISIK